MSESALNKMVLSQCLTDIIKKGNAKVIVPESREELYELALGGKGNDTWDVNYDIDGKTVREAYVIKVKNGIVANFDDINMRRRDPNS
ncbi:MAG: DUF4914 family protein, partial [Firmicutes bacterium]|nr:DUF4914 family protein [Bacillota bacterium]